MAPPKNKDVGNISPKSERSPTHLKREGKRPLKKQKAKPKRNALSRLIRWIVRTAVRLCIAAIVIICTLILLYIPSGVRPISMLMLRDIFMGSGFTREWVPLDNIAPIAQRAVIAAEDGKFCTHNGVDFDALETVVKQAADGGRLRGASTVSMQTVKNLFLWSDRSFIRKGVEIPLAIMADGVWGKRRMMEIYLNSAEWGKNLYGIEAASQRYYGISAAHLNASQAARLVAMLPNPRKRNPNNLHPDIAAVADTIQSRAYASGSADKCLE